MSNVRNLYLNQVVPSPRGICVIERTAVAGTKHVPRIRSLAESLRAGSCLALVRDCSNPHDRFAVKVMTSGGALLGFLSCEFNEVVSRLLDGGKHLHATVTGVTTIGSWTKIEMAVVLDD